MKRFITAFCIFLLLTSCASILLPAGLAGALGAPSDNTTVTGQGNTGGSTTDNTTGEMEQPPVEETVLPGSSLEAEEITDNETAIPPPVTPPEENEEPAESGIVIILSNPAMWTATLFVLVLVAVALYFIWRRKGEDELIPAVSSEAESPRLELAPAPVPAVTPLSVRKEIAAPVKPAVRAKLILPGGNEIRLASDNKTIGRADLARVLSLDELGLISRRHLNISYQDGIYYLEDSGSTGGTAINDIAVDNGERVALKDDDLIKLAGSAVLQFKLISPTI